jgi:hypothetical protein
MEAMRNMLTLLLCSAALLAGDSYTDRKVAVEALNKDPGPSHWVLSGKQGKTLVMVVRKGSITEEKIGLVVDNPELYEKLKREGFTGFAISDRDKFRREWRVGAEGLDPLKKGETL